MEFELKNNLNAGSIYSNIDWHSRLKLPQYRTQSDNLTPPEATCAPTTFAMMAERAGFSRESVVLAIDNYLIKDLDSNKSEKAPQASLNKAWESRAESFFKKVNEDASEGWQKIRAGRISTKKFGRLAKNFRINGQYEDLVYFYEHLINNGTRGQVNSRKEHNNTLRAGIENNGDYKKDSSFKLSQITLKNKLDSETREKIKNYLNKGYPMMFSIFHKSDDNLNFTHNVSVLSIEADGIVVDDPYGSENPEYRNTGRLKENDLFADIGSSRGNSNFKNKVKYGTKDYTKSKAQNLEHNERRGRKTKLTWDMLNDSKDEIIRYINVWEKK